MIFSEFFSVVFLLFSSSVLCVPYQDRLCVHKPLTPRNDVGVKFTSARDNFGSRVRRQARPHRNIVIKFHYDPTVTNNLEASQKLRLESLLDDAEKFWTLALQVEPLTKNIRFYPECTSNLYYEIAQERFCHLACSSVPLQCGETTVPEDHQFGCSLCKSAFISSCSKSSNHGNGIANADYLFYVSAVTTDICNGMTQAYAGHCLQNEGDDRPIAGYINFCPETITTNSRDYEVLVSTVKHEMLHALGFSRNLFAFFRDDYGRPRTRRRSNGMPPLNSAVTGYQWSSNVIKIDSRKKWTRNGTATVKVALVVLPRVLKEARAHFNCSKLVGVELENQGGTGTALSHWEKRMLEHESMTGTHTQNPAYSRITFALMEDTGWYVANYSMSQPLAWGRDLGCDFVMKSCGEWIDMKLNEKASTAPYCTELKDNMANEKPYRCSPELDAVAVCNLVEYKADLPDEFQNFRLIPGISSSKTGRFGGFTELADYCPFYREIDWAEKTSSGVIVNRDSRCELPENMPVDNIGLETYGRNSKCFTQGKQWSKVARSKINPSRTYVYTMRRYGAGCYQYKCMKKRVVILVGDGAYSYNCYRTGQEISIKLTYQGDQYDGSVICPAYADICQV